MDYESRHVKWYNFVLFMLYCGGTVYLLFNGNPYLYSHQELASALKGREAEAVKTIPTTPIHTAKADSKFYYQRYDLQRSAQDPLGEARGKSYVMGEAVPVDIENLDAQNVVSDEDAFYVSGKSSIVAAIDSAGHVRWQYRFKTAPDERGLPPVLVDGTSAYLVHRQGEVVCVDKMSGEMRWVLPMTEDVVANPILWEGFVIVPVKEGTAISLRMINRTDGTLNDSEPRIDAKPGFLLTRVEEPDLLVAVADNKVTAYNPDDWEVEWSQTLTDPVRGPAVASGSKLYVATLGAKMVRLDAAHKGKIDWETDIGKPPAGPAAYIPAANKLAVLDTSGHVAVIDAATGKPGWQADVEAKGVLTEPWAARMKGSLIQEFKMDWTHKGWSLWTPCSAAQFCIWSPGKGAQIARVQLPGQPVALPLMGQHKLAFLVKSKASGYAVVLAEEASPLKKTAK